MIRYVIVFSVAWLGFNAAQASDKHREQDYAAALQKNLAIGQIVWLKAGAETFLGLYTEAEKTDNSAAAIILHDVGDHPDQQPLVHGLRTILPQHNWATLALQLPLRETGSDEADYYPLFDEAKARVQAAIDFLNEKGAKNIAVIGYGLGAEMAIDSINAKPESIKELVAISLPLAESAPSSLRIDNLLKNIALPILDIYAEFDLPAVVDSARRRRMVAKENPVFRQIKVDGENHAYQNDPGMLVKRVYSWLALTAAEK